MVYQIHLRCDANVTDDSGGNVYAMAMTEDYLGSTASTADRMKVKNFMLGNLDQPFVVNIGQIITGKDTVTPVSNILTHYVPSIDDTTVEDLHLHEYYTVYVLAVDGKGNPSEVYPEQDSDDRKLRGNIAARSAPVETDKTVSYAPLGGVTYTANLDSDVYFEYILATFTSNVGEAAVTTFFDGILDDKSSVDSRLYVYANVHSGYTGFSSAGWDRAKESIESVVMGNVIANIADVTEYHPYVDTTQPLHTYLYAVNHHPHKTSSLFVYDITPASPSGIQIANVDIFIKDRSFELSFDVVKKTATTRAYVGVFNTLKTNINVSGDEKRDLIENYVHLFDSASLSADFGVITNHEITQFYNGSDHANIVNKDTYHVYVMLFDIDTGETSAIFRRENITIGKFPLLARNDGAFLDNLLVTRENTSVTSNVGQNVREQSNFNAYFGLFDADTVANVDAVNFMVNNYANVTGTVFANINVAAPLATENELWPIPEMTFQYYQSNIDDPASGFKAINVTSNTKLVTYIVDETSANVTYVTTGIPFDNIPSPDVSIEITRKLDDGFEIVCANAEANIVNYVMAFDDFVQFEKFDTGGAFVENLIANALQIESNVTTILTQVHDLTATTASNIVNGGNYHIYSYALQRPEGVYNYANVYGTAVHVPLISYVHVNFDQFVTGA